MAHFDWTTWISSAHSQIIWRHHFCHRPKCINPFVTAMAHPPHWGEYYAKGHVTKGLSSNNGVADNFAFVVDWLEIRGNLKILGKKFCDLKFSVTTVGIKYGRTENFVEIGRTVWICINKHTYTHTPFDIYIVDTVFHWLCIPECIAHKKCVLT